MASSRIPACQLEPLPWFLAPASSPGVLGFNDRANPDLLAVVGDTPGALGMTDRGTPLASTPPDGADDDTFPKVTEAQMTAIATAAKKPGMDQEVKDHLDKFNDAMKEFEINTRLRQAMFLANIAEETGGLATFTEGGNKSYFDQYDGRFGNTQAGDGYLFRGRGLVQLTFRGTYQDASNYFKYGTATTTAPRTVKKGKKTRTIPGKTTYAGFTDDPDKAADPEWKYRIAGWFWTIYKKTNNVIGDAPAADISDFKAACVKLNGKMPDGNPNGYAVRLKYYRAALIALEVSKEGDDVIKAIDTKVDALTPKPKPHAAHGKGHGHAPAHGGAAHPAATGAKPPVPAPK